ncbi:hypothetical protein CTI12_AA426330 [Artemisia annua]|uniref:Uncharacterized protein n=1 Tax=Artemisia annua TaxID=35608 RepID=A0A2U1M261_ARTAN|nr:hypothetical protein CTI12_AA426330 [Artemisia annua]
MSKQLQDNGLEFEHLVDQSAIFEPKIRACYHKYLDYDGETLAWIMAIDVSFLLEFLDVYTIEKRSITRALRMSHLVCFSCRKFAHNAILRDVGMLENQIPIFLSEKMLEVKFLLNSLEYAKTSLASMLFALYKELSPFRVLDHKNNLPSNEDCTHLLGFLYHMVDIVDPDSKEQCYGMTDKDLVLRNLVAYEVCSDCGPLFLTHNTELMNGIIDTEQDAKFRRKKGQLDT